VPCERVRTWASRDALTPLFAGSGSLTEGAATVSFDYAGYEIKVTGDGEVTVTEL